MAKDRWGNPRLDIHSLLLWAERQPRELSWWDAQAAAADLHITEGVRDVAATLYFAITFILDNEVCNRYQHSPYGEGLELWRRICADMRGSAPEVVMANAERYTQPTKARNVAALWHQLNAWESLGIEVEASGLRIEDWQ